MSPLTFSRVSLAGPLWTVAEAKAHARISDAANDADVAQKLAAAQEQVLALLGPAADATWTPATAPEAVKNSILLLMTHYFEHRGDDIGKASGEAVIWQEIRNNLDRYRDPTLA